MKRLVVLVVLVAALCWPAVAGAESFTALWVNVHRDGRGFPSSAQLAPFTDAAGWQDQEVVGPRWWRYAKGTRSPEGGLPEAWYVHTADGRRIHDAAHPRLFVMNPEKRGWWLHVAPDCAIRCFLDGLGSAAMLRTVPRMPASWTGARWLRATTEEVRGITSWGGTVLPNSAFSRAYVREWTAAGGRASTEGFRGMGDRGLLSAGRVWVFAKAQSDDRCGYLAAVYLTARGRGDHFSCFELGREPWDVPASLAGARVGRALAPAVRISGGWRRSFANAVVVARWDGSWAVRYR